MRTWINADNPAYNGGQLVLRRAQAGGWGFDFNYTFAKSMDIASGSESSGNTGTGIQDAFNPKASRSISDFDIRHNITANTVTELPFGRGKRILGNASGLLDQIVCGWHVSMLARYRSGLPITVSTGGCTRRTISAARSEFFALARLCRRVNSPSTRTAIPASLLPRPLAAGV